MIRSFVDGRAAWAMLLLAVAVARTSTGAEQSGVQFRHTVLATTGTAAPAGGNYFALGYGLALDNLTSVDVVTADGHVLTANSEKNPELFWGVRGSGGNLGIVTSLQYHLHEVGPVLGGVVLHPVARTRGG